MRRHKEGIVMKDLQKLYEGIQKYTAKVDDSNYKLMAGEANAILTCSPDLFQAISLAFKFGFEKGCHKTKKAVRA